MSSQAANSGPEEGLCFRPSQVEGVPHITEATLYPDRLELVIDHQPMTISFHKIARWWRHGWYYRLLGGLGFGIRGFPSVANRDWYSPTKIRYFEFYTNPTIRVFMPEQDLAVSYLDSVFFCAQRVIAAGGFSTFDMT